MHKVVKSLFVRKEAYFICASETVGVLKHADNPPSVVNGKARYIKLGSSFLNLPVGFISRRLCSYSVYGVIYGAKLTCAYIAFNCGRIDFPSWVSKISNRARGSAILAARDP